MLGTSPTSRRRVARRAGRRLTWVVAVVAATYVVGRLLSSRRRDDLPVESIGSVDVDYGDLDDVDESPRNWSHGYVPAFPVSSP